MRLRFIDLLDPRPFDETGAPLPYAQVMDRAAERFPDIVRACSLNYWEPGDPVFPGGVRVLLVLLFWSDTNLVLLDLIAEQRRVRRNSTFHVDVGMLGQHEWSHWQSCLQGLKGPPQPPFVSVWGLGEHIASFQGYDAIEYMLETFEVGMTPAEFFGRLDDLRDANGRRAGLAS